MFDFKNSIWRLIHTRTLSYDMSIVDLTANISQYKKELYNNCIRIPVCFSWKWGHPMFCGHILSLFLFFSIINLLYTCITEGASDVWIGLNDNKEQNFFEWINGEVTKYTNWNVNQPANTNSQNENCVMINKTVSDVIKLTFHLFIRMGIQYSFTTTYAISAYHHWCCEFESRSGPGVQHYAIKFVSDLWQVGGFPCVSLGPPVSSTNETDHHDITEILLKVALNTIKQTNKKYTAFPFYKATLTKGHPSYQARFQMPCGNKILKNCLPSR